MKTLFAISGVTGMTGNELVSQILSNPDSEDVILGFDTTLTYEKLDKASRFLEQGAIFYGVHEDRVCPVEGGHMMPDCGATIGPPFEREYAVEPVGVATIRPSA